MRKRSRGGTFTKNKDRINFLKERIVYLNKEIEVRGLADEFSKRIKSNDFRLKEISEEEWDCMLHNEQEENLLDYYISLRIEYKAMVTQKNDLKGKATKWLEEPWVKIGITSMTVINFFINLLTHLPLACGLFCATSNNKVHPLMEFLYYPCPEYDQFVRENQLLT